MYSSMANEDGVVQSRDLAKLVNWMISSRNLPACKSDEYVLAIEMAYSLI